MQKILMDKDSKEFPDKAEWLAQSDDKTLEAAKKRALRILGDRYMSRREIERRLISKGELEDAAREAAAWLEDTGAINDREYAAMIGRHYTAKGYGLAKVRNELFRRGIPREMWDEVIAEAEKDGVDKSAIEFLRKRLNGSREKNDLYRASDALQRRGFSYEEARTAVKKYLELED